MRLPPAALIAQGLAGLLAGLRAVVEAQAGLLLTIHASPISGVASCLDLAPLARPGDSECVLVQGGRRAGRRLEEALGEAQEGALILLRPGRCQLKGGPARLSTAGVTLAGDGLAEDCIIIAANGGAHRAAVLCTASRQRPPMRFPGITEWHVFAALLIKERIFTVSRLAEGITWNHLHEGGLYHES
jgi:hypothetical protein